MRIALAVIVLIAASVRPVEAATELVVNGSFEQGLAGWTVSRARAGTGVSVAPAGERRRGRVLAASSDSGAEWAVTQTGAIAVRPGETYELSAWMRGDLPDGEATLGVLLHDSTGAVAAWRAGPRLAGPEPWTRRASRFVVPAGCVRAKVRIVGRGMGRSRWDGISLRRMLRARPPEAVRLARGLSMLSDGSWQWGGWRFPGPGRGSTLTSVRAAGPEALHAELIAPDGTPATLVMTAGEGWLEAELRGEGALGRDVEFPAPVVTQAGDAWILPFNEGVKVPAGDPGFRYTWDVSLVAGHFISMPFVAVQRGRRSLLMIAETPADAALRMTTRAPVSFSFVFRPSMGTWSYARRVRFESCADYVDVAAHYRAWAEARGRVVTLRQKARANPAVKRLLGAVNVWRWKNGPRWEVDPRPEAFAAELESSGVDRVLWSQRVYRAESARAIRRLGYLVGRYTNFRDLFPDDTPLAWVEKRGWPAERVQEPDGSWRRGWVQREKGKTYQAGVRCSIPGLPFARRVLSAQQAEIPYDAVFLDTTTAEAMNECHHPDHPHDVRGDIAQKLQQLALASGELGLVTGSESGLDLAVPYVAYFEGMLSISHGLLRDSAYDLFGRRAPTASFRRFQVSPRFRVPLFELVYHDCVVSYFYYGDASNRLPEYWDQRDLLCILYGQPPLWQIDDALWRAHKDRFLKSYRDVVPVARKLAGRRMLAHRVLDRHGMVQETEWAGGIRVRVDFGTRSFTIDPPLDRTR
jgi:hypothetical protein